MSEIETLRLNGGMTREGVATGGPSLDAMEASSGGRRALERLERHPSDTSATRDLERHLATLEDAVRRAPGLTSRYEGVIRELRDALRTQLPPHVAVTDARSSTRDALTALRRGHPQRAARLLIGGRNEAALRRLNVEPQQLESRLRRAGFRDDEVQTVRGALDAEIGRRFQSLVRRDAIRVVEQLEQRLDRATRGDSQALRHMEDELFSARGPDLLERFRRAGANTEADALDPIMMARDRASARPHLRTALRSMLEVVREQAELIRRGDEGTVDRWGSAYRAFETSVQRQARVLGLASDPAAELKDASVLERAVHRSVVETRERHDQAVETGRGLFDLAMGLAGHGLVVGARGVFERRMSTVDAQRRAVAGNGTVASAREAETREVVGTARAVGTAALGSLVDEGVEEVLESAGAEQAIEQLGDRVFERTTAAPIMTPGRESVRRGVRRAVEHVVDEAVDHAVETPQRTLEQVRRREG